MFKRRRKKQLTRAECLERLRECMEKSSFKHELTDNERLQMDYSLQIITCYVRLNDTEEITEVRAIGFGAGDEDEEDDETEYEDEDDED